jgi:hypothetical protein
MPTAVVKPKTKAVPAETAPKIVTAEERTRIKQEREVLVQELAHAQENFAIAQAALEEAADPGKDPQVYVDAHRDYTEMAAKVSKAQVRLGIHRQHFLSDEEIEKRDREEREAKDEAIREAARLEVARPLQKRLEKAVLGILEARATFDEVHKMLSSTATGPFNNNFEVAELCRTGLRNLLTNDPKYKIWLEGGAGADHMLDVVRRAAR